MNSVLSSGSTLLEYIHVNTYKYIIYQLKTELIV